MSSGTRRSIASQISSASVAVAPSCRSGMALVIAARCSRSSMMGSWVGPLGSPRTMHCTHARYEAMPIATLVVPPAPVRASKQPRQRGVYGAGAQLGGSNRPALRLNLEPICLLPAGGAGAVARG